MSFSNMEIIENMLHVIRKLEENRTAIESIEEKGHFPFIKVEHYGRYGMINNSKKVISL